MENTKTYVFDTSYLIEHPEAINNITGDLVIPAIVLKQLDGLKTSDKEDTAKRVRAASNAILESQRSGRLKIVGEFKKVDMLASYVDNMVVGTAVKMKETCSKVVLLTTDTNMKIAAESAGLVIKESAKVKRPAKGKIFALIMAYIVIGLFCGRVFNPVIGFIVYSIAIISTVIYFYFTYERHRHKSGDYESPTSGFDYNKATDRVAAGYYDSRRSY